MGGIVEKFNPRKTSALSHKRDERRGDRWGKSVDIREITFNEVKHDAIDFGLATDVTYQAKAGKEASIFIAKWGDHPILLKAYRLWTTAQARSFRGFNALERMEMVAAKEYDILLECFKAGVHVPTPVGRVGNYLTMRLIGDEGLPASQLRDVTLESPELVLDQILDDYLIMYRDAHWVHGDLSGYNVLWWQERPWIIDVPQAYRVNAWADMKRVKKLLSRDIRNLLADFKRYGVRRDISSIVDIFLDEYVPNNLQNFDEVIGGESFE